MSKNFVKTHEPVRHPNEVDDGARTNATRLMVWLLCASLIAVGVATSYALWLFLNESPRFRLAHVEISGNRHASREEVLRYLALNPNDNVFSVDLELARESLSRHPWISNVELRRVVPDTIVVEIEEHKPIAIAAMSKLYYLNEAGEPFARVVLEEAPDLPMLTGVREGDHELVMIGVQFHAAAKRAGVTLTEIELDDSLGVIAHLVPAGTTAQLGFGDFDNKLRRLKDVRALLVERGQAADSFLLDNPRHPDAVIARLNTPAGVR